MAPFPSWSNSLLYLAMALVVALVLAVPLALWLWVRTPYNTGKGVEVVQPLFFDHRHHVGDDGIDCRYCHFIVERSPYAGVPPTDLCMNCHGQIWNSSALLAPLRDSFFGGRPLVWKRVNALPDYVYFNHSIHVARNVGCVTCHGRIDQMANVAKAAPFTMQWCLGCHRDPAPNLRPQARITDMTWQATHPRALGEQLQRLHNISPPTYCTGCHR